MKINIEEFEKELREKIENVFGHDIFKKSEIDFEIIKDKINFPGISLQITRKEQKMGNTITTDLFLRNCEKKIWEYYGEHNELTKGLNFEIYTVWYSKTLQNHKCLMSTNSYDTLYFEFTYNGDKNELYIDVYEKVENKCYEI